MRAKQVCLFILISLLVISGCSSDKDDSSPKSSLRPVDSKLAEETEWLVYTSYGEKGGSLHSVALNVGKNILLDEGEIDSDKAPQISADGQKVVYKKSDQLTSVPIRGGKPQTLGTCDGLVDVTDAYALCLNYGSSGGYDLYSVPLDKGDPIKLNPKDSSVYGDYDVFIETNGQYVVFATYNQRSSMDYVYSVPITGGEALELAGPNDPSTLSYYLRYLISPDRQHFLVDFAGDRIWYGSITTAKGNVVASQSDLVDSNDKYITTDIGIDPTGTWLAFMVSGDGGVYSVKLDGGSPKRLDTVGTMDWGNRILVAQEYVAYKDDNSGAFRTASLSDGKQGLQLNDVGLCSFSPDGILLAFIKNEGLFSASASGGSPAQLAAGDVKDFGFTPDSSRIIYLIEELDGFNLYSIPAAGGDPVKLNQVPGSKNISFVERFTVTADGEYVIYSLDEETVGQMDIYSVPVAGGTPTRLTPETGYSQMVIYPPGNGGAAQSDMYIY